MYIGRGTSAYSTARLEKSTSGDFESVVLDKSIVSKAKHARYKYVHMLQGQERSK